MELLGPRTSPDQADVHLVMELLGPRTSPDLADRDDSWMRSEDWQSIDTVRDLNPP